MFADSATDYLEDNFEPYGDEEDIENFIDYLDEAPTECEECGHELEMIGVGASESGYMIGRYVCLKCPDCQGSDFYAYLEGPFEGYICPDEDIARRA